ncbi:MAG TPA: hypothetical protein VF950_19240 [Planctomycetota bacterium]
MAPRKPAPVKRFVILVEVEGSTTDGDTPISRQALIDLMEMQFANPKGLKIVKVDAHEA